MAIQMNQKAVIIALIAANCIAQSPISYGAKLNNKNNNSINVGEVSSNYKNGKKPENKADEKINFSELAKSTQTKLAVTRSQLKFMPPNTGAFQLAARLPGVLVLGSNPNSGVGSNSLNINGFGVGTGPTVNGHFNSIQVNFDGIPLSNPLSGDGGFYSVEVPIAQLLNGVTVAYGPGNPDDRWQSSIGGTVNFLPIQPSATPSVKVDTSYGSYGSQTEVAIAKSGLFADGWSVVAGFGHTSGRAPGLEYDYPTQADVFFGKVSKITNSGNAYSLGLYISRAKYLAIPSIPLTPLAGYTVNGYNVPGPLLSEQTSGFYSTETPGQSYFQYKDNMWLLYGKQHWDLSKKSSIDNKIWFKHSHRVHVGHGTYNGITSPYLDEYYPPIFYTIGDRIRYTTKIYNNHIKIGGYLYYMNYKNPYILYNAPVLNESVGNFYYEANNDTAQMSEFAYGQDDIKLFNNRLSITPGIAYAAYQTTDANLLPPTGSPLLNGHINGTFDSGVYTSFGGFEPSLGINFEAIRHLYLYGYAAHTNANPENESYGNEYTFYIDPSKIKLVNNTDFEVGVKYKKNNLFGSINYYHDQVNNIVKGLYANGTALFPTGYKLGNALYQGVNLQLSWKPIYWLNVYASANIQHPYYTKLETSSGGSFSGNVVSGVPLHSFLVGLAYKNILGPGAISANIDDQYVGAAGMANPITGDNTLRTNPYNLVDLTLGYKTSVFNSYVPFLKYARFKVSIFNLLGRKYNESESVGSGINVPGLPANAVFGTQGAPRTVFGTVSLKF
ncbi:TonB-dependent receptor [Acidithiobacillus sp. IBUN Pt1247-S3]